MIRTLFYSFFLIPAAFGASFDQTASPAATLTVRLYNLAEVPEAEFARALEEATEIFGRIGVRPAWLHCAGPAADAACNEVHGPSVVNLRLMSADALPEDLPKGIFGFALMSQKGGFAAYANVYFGRVSQISDGRKYRRDVLLGAMISHELGHLLLGVNSHSKAGLMTLPWTPKVLTAADQGTLVFSKREASKIRKAVEARWGDVIAGDEAIAARADLR